MQQKDEMRRSAAPWRLAPFPDLPADSTWLRRVKDPKDFPGFTVSERATVPFVHEARTASIPNARLLECSCFNRAAASYSIRCENKADIAPGENFLKYSRWMPKARWSPEFLNTIDDVCQVLYELIFRKTPEPGLVVVAGSTNSSKSQIARGLVCLRLRDQFDAWRLSPTSRKPHLVTAEDPIEEYLVDLSLLLPDDNGWVQTHTYPDYTPRQLATLGLNYGNPKKGNAKDDLMEGDVQNIEQAVNDALRQTPSIFFVGETRKETDWDHLLKIAGSHLTVTTTHAGSVSETLSAILRKARTPEMRSEIGERLSAVVHISFREFGNRRALIPALWRRTESGLKALVSDGLASILPYNFTTHLELDRSVFSLGRQYFAGELVRKAQDGTGRSGSRSRSKAPTLTGQKKELEKLKKTLADLDGIFADQRADPAVLRGKLQERYQAWEAVAQAADTVAKRERAAFSARIDKELIRQYACYCDLRGE